MISNVAPIPEDLIYRHIRNNPQKQKLQAEPHPYDNRSDDQDEGASHDPFLTVLVSANEVRHNLIRYMSEQQRFEQMPTNKFFHIARSD